MIDALSSVSGPTASVAPLAGTTAPAGTAAAAGADFGQVFRSVVSDGVAALKAGEAAAIQGVEGKLPAQQVVESVLAAERAFQTGLAVRDKLVSAFQELTRLSI